MNHSETSGPVPFLKMVADYLLEHHADDLSRLVIVFPNKRAGLFLDEYLQGERTCWAPRYSTITELFQSLSPLRPNNDIDTVCRLHALYVRLTGSREPLDAFFGWGERMLADFDDIDKNLVPAKQLLDNAGDYAAIDFGDGLTAEQRELVQRFFRTCDIESDSDDSSVRRRFAQVWQQLWPLYDGLRQELQAEGLAYEGMLFRSVVEQLQAGTITLPSDVQKYVFVGFNALERAEEALFEHLQACGQALFFWDYDDYYVGNDEPLSEESCEAGSFVGRNLKHFPSPLPASCFRRLQQCPPTLEMVAASSENAQAYSLHSWLPGHLAADPRRTAIVLCNEGLLEPVLHAFPRNVAEVNVTKGFPLAHTPVFRDITRFLDEEADRLRAQHGPDGKDAEGGKLLLDRLQEFVHERARTWQQEADAASADGDEEQLSGLPAMTARLCAESCFLAHRVAAQLADVADTGRLQLGPTALSRLVRRLLRQQSVPLHGRPARGVQVMGLLETRCLDFEHILMLSAGEGNLPAPATGAGSLIPPSLRAAYGLPPATRQTAVSAYHLMRLLQRARTVRFTYNDFASPLRPSEMSRFLLQFIASGHFSVRHLKLSAPVGFPPSARVEVPKPAGLYDLLNPRRANGERAALSPSSLNLYLDCPLRFYLHRLARLHRLEPDPDDVQDNMLGNLFHDAAEAYYSPYIGKDEVNFKFENGRVLSEKPLATLRECIGQAYKNRGMKQDVIATETVLQYLRNLLQRDAELQELRIIGLEQASDIELDVRVKGETLPFLVGGRIDRLDVATRAADDGEPAKTLRVLDYKTGVREHAAPGLEEVFHSDGARPYYLFQALLYTLAESGRTEKWCGSRLPMSAALFHPALAVAPGYDPWLRIGKGKRPLHALPSELMDDFANRLRRMLEELLDGRTPFRPTPGKKVCEHCDFSALCGAAEGG